MYTIDIVVRNTPLPISIERKEADDAEQVYQQVLSAMKSESFQIVELTCEKQEGKKVAIVSSAIVAAIVSQKSGSAATGRTPGFFSTATAQ
ncbi:MAG: hypothetical protein QNJ70_03010 [Xenococcaceae cyanobacterium MO_207.B15]|nr:hypothetical protein [Xenococcaceae cyanobacterium MO_207.B15]MDJ0742774.1 hypothetical protein [Xenococcaceae cyanobacterium MO_167.B27]